MRRDIRGIGVGLSVGAVVLIAFTTSLLQNEVSVAHILHLQLKPSARLRADVLVCNQPTDLLASETWRETAPSYIR